MPLPSAFTSHSTALERALDQNTAVQESVEQSAADLCVVAAVLEQEVPTEVQTGDVAIALDKTQELENRIQHAADELAEVNQALQTEIGARKSLEQELASTRAALEQSRGASEVPQHTDPGQPLSH